MAAATDLKSPVVHGVLQELITNEPMTAVVTLPGTDYRLHLVVDEAAVAKLPPAGKRLAGTIRARAKRVDKVHTGGRYIEPVYGRPRRVQGLVIAIDDAHNTITVQAACPMVCELTSPGQKAGEFADGDLVSFDVEKGARLELA